MRFSMDGLLDKLIEGVSDRLIGETQSPGEFFGMGYGYNERRIRGRC